MSAQQNRGPRIKEAPEMGKDWEDEYRRLYEKHSELKLLCSQQDDHIKKLQTKVRKLENDFIQLERTNTKGSSAKIPIDKEEENVIGSLKDVRVFSILCFLILRVSSVFSMIPLTTYTHTIATIKSGLNLFIYLLFSFFCIDYIVIFLQENFFGGLSSTSTFWRAKFHM
jgi:hypothetical protein